MIKVERFSFVQHPAHYGLILTRIATAHGCFVDMGMITILVIAMVRGTVLIRIAITGLSQWHLESR